jgi:hypothetical protein
MSSYWRRTASRCQSRIDGPVRPRREAASAFACQQSRRDPLPAAAPASKEQWRLRLAVVLELPPQVARELRCDLVLVVALVPKTQVADRAPHQLLVPALHDEVVSKKCVSLRRRDVREPPTRADRDLEQVRSLAFGRSEIGGDELAEVLAFRDALRYEMDKSRPHWRSVTGRLRSPGSGTAARASTPKRRGVACAACPAASRRSA